MVLYNVTVSIDEDVSEEWLQWMRTKHIPDVLATGLFIEAKIMKILAEESGGKAYSIMYKCKDHETLQKYMNEHAPALQDEHTKRYSGKFGAFRTLLDIVEEF